MPLILHGLRQAARRGPLVIYLHPWELDAALPRLPLGWRDTFITYHNVGRPMQRRLQKLLETFAFQPMIEILSLNHLQPSAR